MNCEQLAPIHAPFEEEPLRGKIFFAVFFSLFCGSAAFSQNAQWVPNDESRPVPNAVTPGSQPGTPPSDATMLFDGTSLSAWEARGGGEAKWQIKDGALEVAPGTGNIHTKQGFGDCQLHLEWREPSVVHGDGQSRGNSGVMLMSLFEVQVLDSWQNPTYADGAVGGIYGQYPPLVIAGRKPGEWQTYDIVFRRPLFDGNGQLTNPARITVFQNGVVVQDNTRPTGPTAFHDRPPYIKGPEKMPLTLQDHGAPVQFRNIWIRELPAKEPDLAFTTAVPAHVDAQDMALYVGHYEEKTRLSIDFAVGSNGLTARIQPVAAAGAAPRPAAVPVELVSTAHDVFLGEWEGSSMRVTFTRDGQNHVVGTVVQQAATFTYAAKTQ
jgi:hypothetical protein